MKKFNKGLSVILVIAMLCGALSCTAFAASSGTDFTITNPYADVDWSTYKQYKADLHSHTTASDGDDTLKDMLEKQYSYDFDVVAVSDHGTSSYSWTEANVIPALKVAVSIKGESYNIETLNADGGVAANGLPYALRVAEDTEYYYQILEGGEKGHEMMRVPYAIENNPSSLNNAHVNSFFVDYGNGVMGGTSDYVTPISNIDELGGVSVINHPGEYTSARDEETTADAYDYSNTHYKYVIDKFTTLLETYPSCIGIDVNSKGDTRTRYDRKLWDILLSNVVPTGRNVFAVATSDAHSVGAVYTGYTEILMEENTVTNMKNALQNGQFFACSKWVGNPEEITDIANDLLKSSNKTVSGLGQKMLDMQANNATAKYQADKSVEAPVVTGISVDEANDIISVKAVDGLSYRWISNGETIAYGNTIDLNDYEDQIGSYVRCEIFGEGGIVYTQPFMLAYSGAPSAEKETFVDLWWLASILPDTLVRFIAELPIFDLIWAWMNGESL